METYDLIIVGSGAAGMTAAIYAARYKLKTLLISKETGGVATQAHLVENWPGEKSISGAQLMMNFSEQVKNLGVKIEYDEIKEIAKKDELFLIKSEEKEYHAKTIIVASGTQRRKLNVKGEDALLGKGVSYCATCDAAFFKNKIVAVVGGNDAAATAAVVLSQFASKVYIIYRKSELRCEPITHGKIKDDKKIEQILDANIKEIIGDKKVESVLLDNGKVISLNGVFIEIGGVPASAILHKLGVSLDKSGQIKVSKDMETNVKGVFAAGDITDGSNLKQIITAASQGAIAAYSAFKLLKKGSISESH